MANTYGFEAAGAVMAAPSGLPNLQGWGMRAKLEHAYLELHEPSKDGSLAKAGPKIGKIDFQFNPKELTIAKSAKWGRENGKGNKSSGPPQFVGPQPSKLNLEMFFDASATQNDSVVKTVEKLFACCVPTDQSQDQKKGSPPWVLFRWGSITSFMGYISSVSAKYTLFSSSGLPIRAVVTVALEELAGEPGRQNPTSGGLMPRRMHVTVEGDSLASIAYDEYGDASMWRAVAEANRIDNPLRLRAGTTLFLPAIGELAERGSTQGAAGARPGPRLDREVARATAL